MIVRPPVLAASRTVLRACVVLERSARWNAVVMAVTPGAGPGVAEVAARLRGRLVSVQEGLQGHWPTIEALLEACCGALPTEAEPPPTVEEAAHAKAVSALCAAAVELTHIERALRKLPGLPVRSELTGLLDGLGPPGAVVPPVVLDPEANDIDDDGFLALPISAVASPLDWPRLGYGLAAARFPERDVSDWDLEASAWLGPAYAFALLYQAAGLVEISDRLAERIGLLVSDLEARSLLDDVPALAKIAADILPGINRPKPPARHREGAFSQDDLGVAGAVQWRLSAGELACAGTTVSPESIREARDKLVAKPRCSPEEVYAVLEGLREHPFTSQQILNGGWLAWMWGHADWLRTAVRSGDPFETYGGFVLQLDSLLLKSLETASVHRRLVTP